MITRKEVQYVAKLARLGITKSEEERFVGSLSKILGYIEKLKEVNVSKTEPTSHPLRAENVIREDEAKSQKLEVRKKIFEAAPEKEKGHLKVKPIL